MSNSTTSSTKPSEQIATLTPKTVKRSLWTDAVRRFRRNRLAMFGLFILLILLTLAVFADVIAPYEVDKVFLTLRANTLPFVNSAHVLGLDGSSRDYLTRLIFGARTSMLVGLMVPLISFAIGVPLGALAGYLGGKFDFIVMRIVEVATAIPPLLFALFLLSIVGSGIWNVIAVLAVTAWIEPTRLTRAQFITYRERDFVMAAQSLGAQHWRIIFIHILRNTLSPLIVAFTFAVPLAIFAEAGLSFLGIGITEPTASWGKMVGSGIGNFIRVYYHIALFPTIMVALTMLAFSFVGDGLQEALDPQRADHR
ncbi:MAG: ABC transporter permease [Chloroflexi bacterium]|uniref:ABC transporter permease n=1 Tax=Candidatus Flexifilum breve TaxID=3140694 RepID=UPI00313730AC|nr:ABC transporter permease [Chloroflexota bacterium]MBK9747804.1 ABC transporter permease [Chloroflexota bacterium]